MIRIRSRRGARGMRGHGADDAPQGSRVGRSC